MIHQQLSPIGLSNMALQRMEAGDFESAHKMLRVAVNILVTTIPATAINGNDTNIAREIRFSWSDYLPTHPKLSKINEEQQIDTFIYLKGMFVSDHSNPNNKSSIGEAKVVIIYNAALAAQLLGIKKSESALLKQAQALYHLARSVLRKRRELGDWSLLCSKYFFHMAILNNFGAVSFQLTEYDISKSCFERLKKNLMLLLIRGRGQKYYTHTELVGMMTNSIVEPPLTAPCA